MVKAREIDPTSSPTTSFTAAVSLHLMPFDSQRGRSRREREDLVVEDDTLHPQQQRNNVVAIN